MKLLIATVLAFLAFNSPALAEFQVPGLQNPVNDYANVLTPSGKEKIATEIVKLKQETGAQAGVLIVNSLEGDSIEEASMKTATTWKLGDAGKDNGVLLIIAVKDRKMRIEVGRGLEGNLTDSKSKQITSGMRSFLKSGDYNGGVAFAINGIGEQMKAAKAEAVPPIKDVPNEDNTARNFLIGLFLAIVGLITFRVYRSNQKEKELERKRDEEREARDREYDRALNKRLAAGAVTGAAVAAAAATKKRSHYHETPDYSKKEETKKKSDDSSSGSSYGGGYYSGGSSSSSSDSSSSSSSSSSDWGGGGGDFSGGGSSDSF